MTLAVPEDFPEPTTTTQDAFDNISRTTTEGGASQSLSSVMELSSPFASAFQVAMHAVEDDTLAILSLLKGQGLSRTLASPTLVTMSGQEADFLVGGEYPYPVEGEEGSTNIQYKTYGVMLRFTPTVVGEETITLRVEPEVSSLDFSTSVTSGGASVPGLRTRRGATTLQLKDGQTFAMAGLLKETSQETVNKFPFLGDIPMLGTLFTSKEYQQKESELVIIVTPRLVRPMNADEVPPLPGENREKGLSDADFFLLNRLSRPGGTEAARTADPAWRYMGAFSGKAGYSR